MDIYADRRARRRDATREAMARLRQRRRDAGTPDRRAVAEALLQAVLRRRPDSLFACVDALRDAGYDPDESRFTVARLVAEAGGTDVDTAART